MLTPRTSHIANSLLLFHYQPNSPGQLIRTAVQLRCNSICTIDFAVSKRTRCGSNNAPIIVIVIVHMCRTALTQAHIRWMPPHVRLFCALLIDVSMQTVHCINRSCGARALAYRTLKTGKRCRILRARSRWCPILVCCVVCSLFTSVSLYLLHPCCVLACVSVFIIHMFP